jgi:hypothetical protein
VTTNLINKTNISFDIEKDESINKLIDSILSEKELTIIQKRNKIKKIINLSVTKFINSLERITTTNL